MSLMSQAIGCFGFNAVGVAAGGLIAGLTLPAMFGRDYATEKDKTGLGKDPCGREIISFIECTRTLKDTGGCEGLLAALAECRQNEGNPLAAGGGREEEKCRKW